MQLLDIDYAKVEKIVAALVAEPLSEEQMLQMNCDELLAHAEEVRTKLRPLHVMVGALSDHAKQSKLRAQLLCDHPKDQRESMVDAYPNNMKRVYWCGKCGKSIK